MQKAVSCQWCEEVLNKGGKNNVSLILQCSGCQRVSYCNKKCQRKDWVLHQMRCPLGSGGVNNNNDIDQLSRFEEVCDTMAQMPHRLDTAEKRAVVIQVLGQEEPLHLFWSRYIEVKRSEYVHGRGLFVSMGVDGGQQPQCLPAGAAITCHPAHLLFDSDGKLVMHKKRGGNNNNNDNNHPLRDMSQDQIQELINSYGAPLGPYTVVGLPDQCQDKRLLGHMVNDACLVDVFASFTAEELKHDLALLKRLLVTLLKNVIKYTNCAFLYDARRLVRALVTRREIKPGEELLVSYGIGYWLEKHYGPCYNKRYPHIMENIQKLMLRDTDVQRLLTQSALQLDMPVLMAEVMQQQQRRSKK